MTFDTSNALCTRCGKEFPRAELSPLEDALLCAPCRPLHLEHLRRYHADKSGRRFLFTATGADGVEVTDYVEAANVGAAKYTLELRGYNNITFHEDDISSATQQLFDHPEGQTRMEGEDYLKVVQHNSELYNFWIFLKRNAFLNLLMLAIIVATVYRGQPLHWSAIIAYIYFFLIIGFYIFATVPLLRYNRLTKAVEWGRWDQVDDMVERIRRGNKTSLAKIPEFELDIRSAQVLAARGRIEEGLALLKKYEEDPRVEPFLYYSRRSAIYGTAHDYQNYLADTVKSAELAPASGSMQVDVALAYALRMGDTAAAQRHLDRAREMTLPAMATGWLNLIQGIIYLKDNKPEQADEELQEAGEFFDRMKHLPFMDSCKLMVKTHRAMAAAVMGDKETAQTLFDEARPWLESTDETELLAQCRQAMGSS